MKNLTPKRLSYDNLEILNFKTPITISHPYLPSIISAEVYAGESALVWIYFPFFIYRHSFLGGPCIHARATFSGVSGIDSGSSFSTGRPRLIFASDLPIGCSLFFLSFFINFRNCTLLD